jgi:hypothetical protein
MRVLDLIAQHGIPWPPAPVAAVGSGGRIPTQGEMQNATISMVDWRDEDDGGGTILLWLHDWGGLLTASLPCPKDQRRAYRTLYAALERGPGRTLGEIENSEAPSG